MLPQVVSLKKVRAARTGLPSTAVLANAGEVFKALANPTRLALVHALSHDELTVGDIAHAFEISLSTASHALARLRRLGLVSSRDEGRLTYYRVADDFVGHMVHDCLAHVGETMGSRGPSHHHPHRLRGGASPRSRRP